MKDLVDSWEEEEREARKDRLRLILGIRDLILTVIGALVILALMTMFISMVDWVITDLKHSFFLFG